MVLGEFKKKVMEEIKIGVVGLGYVGLPLARLFATKYAVVGFDLKKERIEALNRGIDRTLEVSEEVMKSVLRPSVPKRGEKGLYCSCDPEDLRDCNYYIITVPTPVDKHNRPDLTPLIRASETVGQVIVRGDIVIYESTVYPGATEEDCIPVIERVSGLKYNVDFFAGYSPERINPGDKEHTLTRILKITSGSTREAADIVDALYHSILEKGTYRASSIKVAEAAKVIENSQRDLNIAFVNELAKIFHLIGIDTHEVLEAAATKWNFLPFKPGLVGGHCIGVDPYYLTHKAQALGYLPEVILAGRRINDGMGQYIAAEVVKLMIKKEQRIAKAKVLVMGITFKENCPDIRNSHAIDVVRGLHDFGCRVTVFDPWADPEDVMREYGRKSVKDAAEISEKEYDAVVLAVAHRDFRDFDVRRCLKEKAVVFDIKGFLPRELVDGRL